MMRLRAATATAVTLAVDGELPCPLPLTDWIVSRMAGEPAGITKTLRWAGDPVADEYRSACSFDELPDLSSVQFGVAGVVEVDRPSAVVENGVGTEGARMGVDAHVPLLADPHPSDPLSA